MTKLTEEREILKLATPLLEKIYGSFEVDLNQTDKPDAAVILKKNTSESAEEHKERRVGIEITSIDKQNDKQYLNDERTTNESAAEELECFQKNRHYSVQPRKSISIPFTNEYIYEGVYKKSTKYAAYAGSNIYSEIIILAHSSYFHLGDLVIGEYHASWTRYLLSEKQFPFDKVIFVCKEKKRAILVYDKKSPQLNCPLRDHNKELGITVAHSTFIPIGEKINIDKLFDQAPLVSETRPKKAKKKKK